MRKPLPRPSKDQSPTFYDWLLPTLLKGVVLPGAAVFLAVRAYSDGFARYRFYYFLSNEYFLTGATLNIHLAQLLCGAIFLNAYYFWYNLFPQKTLLLYIGNLFLALSLILTVAIVAFLP